MKPFTGYKAEKSMGAREIIPAGGYVAKILDAKEVSYSWGSVLAISFDITEGEYKDFFKNDYNAQTGEDKKWRGVCRLPLPKDDGTEQDGWTKNSFNNAMFAIEDSNKGYTWNWDEKTLKGKNTGVLFRNKEWEMNGNSGWTTECYALAPVEDIHTGHFKIAKDKPLKNKPAASSGFTPIPDSGDDGDLPF